MFEKSEKYSTACVFPRLPLFHLILYSHFVNPFLTKYQCKSGHKQQETMAKIAEHNAKQEWESDNAKWS
jgi:hypothetical protein